MPATIHEANPQPWWPDTTTLPARAELDYDPVTDSLLVAFDRTRPAEHAYLETGDHDYVALRLALDAGEVVGIVIEDFHTVALDRHPGDGSSRLRAPEHSSALLQPIFQPSPHSSP